MHFRKIKEFESMNNYYFVYSLETSLLHVKYSSNNELNYAEKPENGFQKNIYSGSRVVCVDLKTLILQIHVVDLS